MAPDEVALSNEQEVIKRKLRKGWIMRCPYGHGDLRDHDGPTAYCQSCRRSYDYNDLVDVSTEGVPYPFGTGPNGNGNCESKERN